MLARLQFRAVERRPRRHTAAGRRSSAGPGEGGGGGAGEGLATTEGARGKPRQHLASAQTTRAADTDSSPSQNEKAWRCSGQGRETFGRARG